MKPSLRQVAELTGFSRSTVASAIAGSSRVAAETRDKIMKVVHDLGYRPNPVISRIMSDLRSGRDPRFLGTLALINGHRDRDAFTTHPTIPIYLRGCRERADEIGYKLDTFWLHEPFLSEEKLLRILSTRGIEGAILVGVMDDARLPAHLDGVWKKIPTVVTGVRTHDPVLPFVAADHHQLALAACDHARRLGYRRPGLVLDAVIDQLIDGRIQAGFLIGQGRLPVEDRVPPFVDVREARQDEAIFRRWLTTYKPDVLFTLYNEVFHWLKHANLKVPRDIGVIQLEWRASRPEIAGLDQNNHRVGAAAVDMLVSYLRQDGPNRAAWQAESWGRVISPTWRDGSSVRTQPVRKAPRAKARSAR